MRSSSETATDALILRLDGGDSDDDLLHTMINGNVSDVMAGRYIDDERADLAEAAYVRLNPEMQIDLSGLDDGPTL